MSSNFSEVKTETDTETETDTDTETETPFQGVRKELEVIIQLHITPVTS